MEPIADLSSAVWRKSSYSDDNGGACIECAPMGSLTWHKSTHSDDNGRRCIEVADNPCFIAVRDSKNPEGPALTFSPDAFASFVAATAGGAFPV
jgi:hypothetical protein